MTIKEASKSHTEGSLVIRSVAEIPELFTNTREKNPFAFVRFHAGWNQTSWYVFEWDGKETFFGMRANERTGARSYGLFSLEDLRALKGPNQTGVIQDYGFQPTRMSELRRSVARSSLGFER